MNINFFGKEKLPSVIQDPFSKNKISEIHVWMSIGYDEKWSAHGVLRFKNGETEGKQSYRGDTFDEVVLKIKATIENL